MYRILFFLALIFVPVTFGWWLFIPLALLAVYLIKLPYEIVLAGFLLDLFYYFGQGFWQGHTFTIFTLILIALALFLNQKIHWRKVI